MAINIQLDALMDKMGIAQDALFEAEEQSDKELARELAKVQRAGESRQRGTTSKTNRKTRKSRR